MKHVGLDWFTQFCGNLNGIQNIKSRLDRDNAQYAPFGPEFPMMLLELCFGGWPSGPARGERWQWRFRCVCFTSSVYCVNTYANLHTNIHTKRVEHGMMLQGCDRLCGDMPII
jgi:hypothetical protein